MADVIAAVATGTAACAIGVVRLSGDGCAQVAQRVCRLAGGRALETAPNRKLLRAELLDRQGRVIDQILVVYTRAPHTYTGEDTVELQCHGAPAVLAAALEALFAAGARQAGPGEFTRRAFLNGQMDLTQAEAVVDLIDAQTADAAANAAGQVGGALLRKIDPLYSAMTDICSHFHAVLDYPDEEIPDFRLADFRRTLAEIQASLQALLDSFQRGQYLRRGVRAVLLGRPNAGKSSLLNALVGYDRAIVTNIPGTTRDTVEERAELGGVTLRLIDTAGLRDSDDPIEQLGVERSRKAMDEAALILLVADGGAEWTREDADLIRAVADTGKPWIFVRSKADLDQRAVSVGLIGADAPPAVEVSAKTGQGLEELAAAIEGLFPRGQEDYGRVIANARQAEAVRRALEGVERAGDALAMGVTPDALLTDVEQALSALGELTGQSVREDITDRIFERFCVGK